MENKPAHATRVMKWLGTIFAMLPLTFLAFVMDHFGPNQSMPTWWLVPIIVVALVQVPWKYFAVAMALLVGIAIAVTLQSAVWSDLLNGLRNSAGLIAFLSAMRLMTRPPVWWRASA